MIKVLIVEDVAVVREFLINILSSDPEIQVIGTANNGEEALEAAKRYKPDLITMDINMPKMNGFEATRRIMETTPTPIVIVTASWDPKEVTTSFRAMEAGALTVLEKPRGMGHPDHESTAKELVQMVKLMSEVKVVRRWACPRREPVIPAAPPLAELERISTKIELVAMGASTGGPMVLQTILSRLPKDFSVPVLIVQHMATGFIQGFVEWLAQTCGRLIHVATQGVYLLAGHTYIAPDGFQMKVERGGKISLTCDEPVNGLRPSISYLFRSVANVYGQNAMGVLLTGMGNDGVEELKLLKDKGAITIAQDEKSSVVYGMPGEAMKIGAATYVLPANKIATVLESLIKVYPKKQP